jgi:hypothetical protein
LLNRHWQSLVAIPKGGCCVMNHRGFVWPLLKSRRAA